jgi:hypothetical protein
MGKAKDADVFSPVFEELERHGEHGWQAAMAGAACGDAFLCTPHMTIVPTWLCFLVLTPRRADRGAG